jgi:hypothetical protein
MRHNKIILGILCIVLTLAAIFCTAAYDTTKNWVVQRGNLLILKDMHIVETLDVDGAQTYGGAVNLDDGTGASPSLTFTDGSDETAVLSKADGANLSYTIAAADSVQVLTGNLAIGDGNPTTTLDGEDAYIEGGLEVDGPTRFDGAVALNGATTRAAAASEIWTASAATPLTTGTVTFTAANKRYITLTSDSNQTGCYPINGTLGQVITIRSGTNVELAVNTMRFDDSAASMTLGANITLTEDDNDILNLICTSADGDEWAALAAHDN